jgi:shikimate kinase
MDVMELTILDYKPEHQPWFEKFNRDWIEEFFTLEPLDIKVLKNPDQFILATGGAIIMASVDREIAGTVGLRYLEPGFLNSLKWPLIKNSAD